MNHLPFLTVVVVVIVAAVLFLTSGSDEQDLEDRGASPPPKRASTRVDPLPDPAEPSAADEAETEPPPAAKDAFDVAAKMPTFRTEGEPGDEVFERLAKGMGLSVSYSDDAWKQGVEEMEVHLVMEDVRWRTVLDLLTEPYGLTWKIQNDVLWILVDGEEPPEEGR